MSISPGGCPSARAATSVATDHLEAHLVPLHGTEVQVHVGRVPAPLVQKALEEQPVGERLGLRESQAIRDQAVRRATPARNGDVLRPGDLFGLVRDQKVRRKPESVDAAKLAVQTTPYLRRRRSSFPPIPSPGPRDDEFD